MPTTSTRRPGDAPQARRVLTTGAGAERLGRQSAGLGRDLSRARRSRRRRGERDGGAGAARPTRGRGPNGPVIGFMLRAEGQPTVYVSGDNALVEVVERIVAEYGPFDAVVLFVGGAQRPGRLGRCVADADAATRRAGGRGCSTRRRSSRSTRTAGRTSARARRTSRRRSWPPGCPTACGRSRSVRRSRSSLDRRALSALQATIEARRPTSRAAARRGRTRRSARRPASVTPHTTDAAPSGDRPATASAHVGRGPAGADRVDEHAVAAELGGERPGQSVQRRLRHVVGRRAGAHRRQRPAPEETLTMRPRRPARRSSGSSASVDPPARRTGSSPSPHGRPPDRRSPPAATCRSGSRRC